MKTRLLLAATAVLALTTATSVADITLNFVSEGGSQITFPGHNISQFDITGTANQWSIGSVDGGTGSASGLFGAFSGGPWTYGAITTDGTLKSAPVSGPATLKITDGSSLDLTADLSWVKIMTVQNAAGILNVDGVLNLSNISYSGANADLLTVANAATAQLVLTFAPSKNLQALTSQGKSSAFAYTGTITAVPEAPTMLAGAGAVVLVLLGIGVHSRGSGVVRIGK